MLEAVKPTKDPVAPPEAAAPAPAIKLTDLIPQRTEITFRNGLIVELRPWKASDSAWANSKFGGDHLKTALEGVDLKVIAQIVYHQLIREHQDLFPAAEIEERDDDGRLVKHMRPGWEAMLVRLDGGIVDQARLYQGLLACIGISMPDLEDEEQDLPTDSEAKGAKAGGSSPGSKKKARGLEKSPTSLGHSARSRGTTAGRSSRSGR